MLKIEMTKENFPFSSMDKILALDRRMKHLRKMIDAERCSLNSLHYLKGELAALEHVLSHLSDEERRRVKEMSKIRSRGFRLDLVNGEFERGVWQSVTLNFFVSSDAITTAINRIGGQVGVIAQELMEQKDFPINGGNQRIRLAALSPEKMFFTEAIGLLEFFELAQSFGFELCPPLVGPAMCQQMSLDKGGSWNIAMEPLRDSKGEDRYFQVSQKDGLWLTAVPHEHVRVVEPDCEWIFVSPKAEEEH